MVYSHSTTTTLWGMCAAMGLGAYISGVVAMLMPTTKKSSGLAATMSAGLLIGAGLCVVVPEGFHSLQEAQEGLPPSAHLPEWTAGAALLLGFLLMSVLDIARPSHEEHEEGCPGHLHHHDHELLATQPSKGQGYGLEHTHSQGPDHAHGHTHEHGHAHGQTHDPMHSHTHGHAHSHIVFKPHSHTRSKAVPLPTASSHDHLQGEYLLTSPPDTPPARAAACAHGSDGTHDHHHQHHHGYKPPDALALKNSGTSPFARDTPVVSGRPSSEQPTGSTAQHAQHVTKRSARAHKLHPHAAPTTTTAAAAAAVAAGLVGAQSDPLTVRRSAATNFRGASSDNRHRHGHDHARQDQDEHAHEHADEQEGAWCEAPGHVHHAAGAACLTPSDCMLLPPCSWKPPRLDAVCDRAVMLTNVDSVGRDLHGGHHTVSIRSSESEAATDLEQKGSMTNQGRGTKHTQSGNLEVGRRSRHRQSQESKSDANGGSSSSDGAEHHHSGSNRSSDSLTNGAGRLHHHGCVGKHDHAQRHSNADSSGYLRVVRASVTEALLPHQHSTRSVADSDLGVAAMVAARKRYHAFQALLGLVIHSASDGLSVGVACTSDSLALSVTLALSVMVHKMPVAYGLAAFLKAAGLAQYEVHRGLLCFVSAAPLTALLSFYALTVARIASDAQYVALCVLLSGGTVLHAGAVHVLPSMGPRPRDLAVMAAFSLVPVAITAFIRNKL